MKHEWSNGDKAVVTILNVVDDGDLLVGQDSAANPAFIHPEHAAPITPDHSQYIGKTLADCPDGTVAVWVWPNGNTASAITDQGRLAHADFMNDRWVVCARSYGNEKEAAILHIIKLGEPKPATLAEAVKSAKATTTTDPNYLSISRDDWGKIGAALAREERQPSA